MMNGLSDKQVAESKAKYGTNVLSRKKSKSIFGIFFDSFKDLWIEILCGALILKLIFTILGHFYPSFANENAIIEIFSIILAILLSTGFTTISDYKNQKRSDALQEEYNKTFAKVLRNGKLISILTTEIVKDDVILIQAGDKIPVDGLIIDGELKVSQAALNGESRDEIKSVKKYKVKRGNETLQVCVNDIKKDDIITIAANELSPVKSILLTGKFLNGYNAELRKEETVSQTGATINNHAKAVIESQIKALNDSNEALTTDYESSQKVFMGSVATSGEAYMVATVIGDESELGKINKSLTDDEDDDRKDTSSLKLEKVAQSIGKLGVSAATIAAVLQVIMTLIHVDKSSITTVFVASTVIDAIMLMASIIIMAVPEGLPMMNGLVQAMNTESMHKKHILVSNSGAFSDSAYLNILFTDKTGTITEGNMRLIEFIIGNGDIIDKLTYDEFIQSIGLNNLAKVSSENKAIGSNNIDRELLTYVINNNKLDVINNSLDSVKEIQGFDSEKKCATVSMKDGSLLWKGATELILDKVTHYMDESGEIKEFTNNDKQILLQQMSKQTSRTMKLLSVAKIDGDKTILYAILCFRDNVRKDAITTVETLNKAGVDVIMVTGDAQDTAVAIAKEAGIMKNPTDIALTHDDLDKLTDDEIKDVLPNLKVVSRAKPLDKKRLVSIAQAYDNVCGMTGDGINDAPALRQADVGFAMGDGTAVAQEAGDVVILNNSLASIKDCILNSRTMAKSVGKFLIFQLTVNVSTLLMNIISPIFGWTEPFSIVEILWINLIMDTLAAMAFGGEPILERYMNEKPAKRKDNILTRYIKSAIGTSAVFITLGSMLILENAFGIADFITPANCYDVELYKRTFMFAFFIYSIIFNSLNTRSEKINIFEHIRYNKNFIRVMFGIFIMQTIILEIGGDVFGTISLDIKSLLLAMVFALLIIPVDFLRKVIISKK